MKQLEYMRKYQKEERELSKQYKTRIKLTHTLTERMIQIARSVVEARRKFPIKIVQDDDGRFLSALFKIKYIATLEVATRTVCSAEDDLIQKTKHVSGIGIIKDLHVSLLDDDYGLVWEIVKPLTV